MLLDEIRNVNYSGLEAEISSGIVERIAREIPELTDHSPGSPHVVMAESLSWGAALLMYYIKEQPELYESWILRYLYGAKPHPPRNAHSEVVITFSTPANEGGRFIEAGTSFSGGGTTWTVLDTFVYPEGTFGNETRASDLGPQYIYRIPVAANAAGSRFNTSAGTITEVTSIMPGVLSVTNPTAASGGEDEESYEDMRERIFAKRLEEDLLVVARDFELAVEHYLGEGARTLVVTPPPEPGFVHLSILYADGNPLVVNSGLKKELDRRSPMAPIRFYPPQVTKVKVIATIHFNAQVTSAAKIGVLAREKLYQVLAPATWERWGSTPNKVYRSELISALQNLPGVASVELRLPADDLDLGSANAIPQLDEIQIDPVAIISGGEVIAAPEEVER